MEINISLLEEVKILESNAASRDMNKHVCDDIAIEEAADARAGRSLCQDVNDAVGVQDLDHVATDHAVVVDEVVGIMEEPPSPARDLSASVGSTVRIRESVDSGREITKIVDDAVGIQDLAPVKRGELSK